MATLTLLAVLGCGELAPDEVVPDASAGDGASDAGIPGDGDRDGTVVEDGGADDASSRDATPMDAEVESDAAPDGNAGDAGDAGEPTDGSEPSDSGEEAACGEGAMQVGDSCEDIDECEAPELNDCDPDPAACVNLEPQAGRYRCSCPAGFTGSGEGEDGCEDVDECEEKPDLCGLAECHNTPGGYSCGDCPAGYSPNEDGECGNIDECESGDPCDGNATCSDREGSFSCTCNDGYDGSGTECTPVDCGALSQASPLVVATPAGTTLGEIAEYDCEEGYDLVGEATRTCQADGSWSGSAPSCEPVDCGAPADSAPLVVSTPAGTTFGETATYDCDSGYDLVGSAERTCQADETWSGSAPSCEPVDCGAPPASAPLLVAVPGDTTFGQAAQYSCQQGYVLAGNATRTCGADQSWSGSTPNCDSCASGYTRNPASACVRERTVSFELEGSPFASLSVEGDASSTCDRSCSVTVWDGARLTANVTRQNHTEVTWSRGACSGDSCAVTATSDLTVTATVAHTHNLAFRSSATFTGAELGGLAGADAQCTALAEAAGLEAGAWVAFLGTMAPCPGTSGGSCPPTARLAGSRGWVNTRGQAVFDTISDIEGYRALHSLKTDEVGDTGSYGMAFTGMIQPGRTNEATCNDWQSDASTAWAGWPQAVGYSQLSNGTVDCDYPETIYCFGTGINQALFPETSAGRTAFVTDGEWESGGGLNDADAFCQREACEAGLTGSANCDANLGSRQFLAFLYTSAGDPRGRYDAAGPSWYRTDGLLWLDADKLTQSWGLDTETALNVTATGQMIVTSDHWGDTVWTGRQHDCGDWTSTAAAPWGEPDTWGTVGSPVYGADSGWDVDAGGRGLQCSDSAHLYCLED